MVPETKVDLRTTNETGEEEGIGGRRESVIVNTSQTDAAGRGLSLLNWRRTLLKWDTNTKNGKHPP
jgi:hypothetical protein